MRIKLLYERLGSLIPFQSLTSHKLEGQDDSPMSAGFEAPERRIRPRPSSSSSKELGWTRIFVRRSFVDGRSEDFN